MSDAPRQMPTALELLTPHPQSLSPLRGEGEHAAADVGGLCLSFVLPGYEASSACPRTGKAISSKNTMTRTTTSHAAKEVAGVGTTFEAPGTVRGAGDRARASNAPMDFK